jgi:hypothetical protein
MGINQCFARCVCIEGQQGFKDLRPVLSRV